MTIQETINHYKDHISVYWEAEKYKWKAVKHYRDYWNINAEDFPGMLTEAFSQATNLLGGAMYYPYGMICVLSQFSPERMRELFRLLYDEKLSLADRIQSYRSGCEELLIAFRESSPDNEKAKNHYQDLRAICVYLSFEYPEKYFLYKARMYSSYKKLIDYKETSTEKNSEVRKYENFSQMCNTVLVEINNDPELQQMQKTVVESDSECYADPEFHLLAQTILYVNNNSYADSAQKKNEPEGKGIGDDGVATVRYWLYAPGKGAEMWEQFYKDGIMAIGWDEIGDLRQYKSKEEMKQAMKDRIDPAYPYKNDSHATWQFANEIKPGDIIFVKKGMHHVIGRGVVESDYCFDANRSAYQHVRKVNWTDKGDWDHPGQAVLKTLTDITPYTDYVEQLNALFTDESESQDVSIDSITAQTNLPYGPEDFLEEVYDQPRDQCMISHVISA